MVLIQGAQAKSKLQMLGEHTWMLGPVPSTGGRSKDDAARASSSSSLRRRSSVAGVAGTLAGCDTTGCVVPTPSWKASATR